MSEKQFDKDETEHRAADSGSTAGTGGETGADSLNTHSAGSGAQAGSNGQQENPMVRKRLFGRGVYGSKDVPIRLLDKLIAGAIVLTVVLIIYSAINGGFHVRFDTDGGSAVAEQKLRYGETVAEPAAPEKPGYVFSGWRIKDTETGWNFELDTVTGSMTLVAQWKPAEIRVKLDLAGGELPGAMGDSTATAEGRQSETGGGSEPDADAASSAPADTAGSSAAGGNSGVSMPELEVIYGEAYGELPEPVRDGYVFAGWVYSGSLITADSIVQTNGEHVLTAQWTAAK